MHSPVIHVSPDDSVEEVVNLMHTHGFSQVPVLDGGIPVGSVSEDMIVKLMAESKKKVDFSTESLRSYGGLLSNSISKYFDLSSLAYIGRKSCRTYSRKRDSCWRSDKT